jgi:phospholipid/cholesterol/gamma-HCH transport system substrate-binding protein
MATEHKPPPPPDKDAPPPQPETAAQRSEPTARAEAVPHLAMKAALLLVFTLALVAGTGLFLLKARGYFSPKQTLVLVTDNSEGVTAGMDLTFSGFPIGTVRKVELGEQGNVRITVDVIQKDAKWLRSSSVFTLVKNILGAAQLRAYSGVLTDPPLAEGAERPVLRGDANEELHRVIGATRDVLENLNDITASNSELNRSMANLQAFTQKLQSRRGALHAVFGNEEDAQKLVQALDRASSAMAKVDRLAGNADRLVTNADREVFGQDGIARDVRATVRQTHALLTDARASLQRADAVLQEVQGIGSNVKSATADLGSLRGDVEANLRKIEDMINDLNRRWPFAKEREVQLP